MKTSRTLAPALLTLALLGTVPAATASPAPVDRDATVLHWHGRQATAHLPLTPDMLPGAPASFRSYVRAQLRATWVTYLHHKPACQGAPDMTVTGLRTDGFAIGDAGTHPVPGCQTGGGYEAFWAIRNGEWKQVIGTQDVPTCARLEKLDFPSAIGVHQCYDGTDLVTYTHP